MHSALVQAAAGLTAMALNPTLALLAAGVNAEAAAITALKIKADIENGKSPNFADLASLTQFAASTTRNAQRGQLDALLADWAATSGFEDMQTKAAAHGYTFTSNLDAAHQARLNVLEQFNGRSFYKMPWDTLNAQSGVTGMIVTGDHITIAMNGTQLALLDQAYSALKESVYDALIPQTRLKPYLDDISLTLTGTAGSTINLDFTVLDTRLTDVVIGRAANDEERRKVT